MAREKKKTTTTEPRTKAVVIRVTDAERDKLKAEAKKKGTTVTRLLLESVNLD